MINDNHSYLRAGRGALSLTLADLKPGDRARIESIETADPAVQRLMVLGLVEGAELTFLRRSLGGDPLEVRIYGAAISLRDAAGTTVRWSTWSPNGRRRAETADSRSSDLPMRSPGGRARSPSSATRTPARARYSTA